MFEAALNKKLKSRENLREIEAHLDALSDLMPRHAGIRSMLKTAKKDLRKVEKELRSLCPHTARTEGPHDTIWCDCCGESV